MKKNLFVLSLFIFLASCDKNDIISENVKPYLKPNINSDVLQPQFRDGRLVFNSYPKFLDFVKNLNEKQIDKIKEWENIEGFTSMSEFADEFYKNTLNMPDFIEIPFNPLLAKIVNKDGLVQVNKVLYQFTENSVKILINSGFSKNEISAFMKTNEASIKNGILVHKLEKNEKNARQAQQFDIISKGNEYSIPGRFLRVGGRIRSYHIGWDIMCDNYDDPAFSYTYICGTQHVYYVDAMANTELRGLHNGEYYWSLAPNNLVQLSYEYHITTSFGSVFQGSPTTVSSQIYTLIYSGEDNSPRSGYIIFNLDGNRSTTQINI